MKQPCNGSRAPSALLFWSPIYRSMEPTQMPIGKVVKQGETWALGWSHCTGQRRAKPQAGDVEVGAAPEKDDGVGKFRFADAWL